LGLTPRAPFALRFRSSAYAATPYRFHAGYPGRPHSLPAFAPPNRAQFTPPVHSASVRPFAFDAQTPSIFHDVEQVTAL